MSVNAQNVKIMTQDGKVTLRGPVKSDDEKKKIEDIALAVAGVGKVDNQLEVELRP
jgi:osmotically-inducible protein OsmY